MAHIKVRFSLNKGRRGAPLAKLGKIAEQAERFLRALAFDSDIETKPGEWLAVEFTDGSVEYDAEFQGDVSPAAAQIFSRNLEVIADFDPEVEGLNLSIRQSTALEYARIGNLIDPDEVVGIGIYPPRGGKPKWRSITYGRSAAIRREIEAPLPSYGAVQGVLHAWFMGARDPHFQLRELSTESLVKVLYGPALYAAVAQAVQEKTSTLIVAGSMLFDRATRQAIELRADRIERIGILSSQEFEAFIGAAPGFASDIDFNDADEASLNG